MSRILVTGALGMLGSTLVPYLQACGYDVIGHARSGEEGAAADLTVASQVRSMLDRFEPDTIVNLAASTNVDECERKPNQAYLSNVKIVENIAGWIRNSKVATHLVQISTDQTYDGPGLHKEDQVALTNYYAFSKYAGELAALSVPSTVLRTNFFGPSRCRGRSSLTDWLFESLQQNKAITVFEDVLFNPLSMQRLCECIGRVVEQRRRGVFNLGTRNGMSKADFAFAFADALGLPTANMSRGSVHQMKFVAYRPQDMRTDSSRFALEFRNELPTLLEEVMTMKVAYGH